MIQPDPVKNTLKHKYDEGLIGLGSLSSRDHSLTHWQDPIKTGGLAANSGLHT